MLAFANKDKDSSFVTLVIPPKDQYEKKEVMIMVDSKEIKYPFRKATPKDAILELQKWGGNPNNVNQLNNLFNEKLEKKETPKEKKKRVKVGLTTLKGMGAEVEYSQKDKYK